MLSHRAKLGIHPEADKKEMNSLKKGKDVSEKHTDAVKTE
jgi:hypothetical protein